VAKGEPVVDATSDLAIAPPVQSAPEPAILVPPKRHRPKLVPTVVEG